MENNRIEGTQLATYDFALVIINCLGIPSAAVTPDAWAAIRPDSPRVATRERERHGAEGAKGLDGPSGRAAVMAACRSSVKMQRKQQPVTGLGEEGRKVALPPRAWSRSWRRGQWPP